MTNSRAKTQPSQIRVVLKTGSTVFGISAVVLILVPELFNQLLGLPASAELDWAMRMIGITLVALAGNMFSVAHKGSDESVVFSGKVMLVSAAGLGVLTLLIPAPLGWFTYLYAAVGFGFSAAYAWALKKK
jgi:O-antigen/teichoic acid export membrane protein